MMGLCAISAAQMETMERLGIQMFNRDPPKGITFLAQHKVVELEPATIAKYLHETVCVTASDAISSSSMQPGLCRAKIGYFLGLVDSRLAMDTLDAYADLFDALSDPFDVCLREFLSGFRLPGEVPLRRTPPLHLTRTAGAKD